MEEGERCFFLGGFFWGGAGGGSNETLEHETASLLPFSLKVSTNKIMESKGYCQQFFIM